jgi:hypothetical protein
VTDEELIAGLKSGLSLRPDIDHELALVREQTRLVNEQAVEIEDDCNAHHGHSGRRAYRPLSTATILAFTRRRS